MKNNVTLLREACERSLKKLQHHCAQGMALTLIIRKPGKEEAEMVISQDNLQELSEIFARAAARQKSKRSTKP
jgi:hypothetical protein